MIRRFGIWEDQPDMNNMERKNRVPGKPFGKRKHRPNLPNSAPAGEVKPPPLLAVPPSYH